jgi:hypothetical protein
MRDSRKDGTYMIELQTAIAALSAYRASLRDSGKLLKAAAVERCIVILRRLAVG